MKNLIRDFSDIIAGILENIFWYSKKKIPSRLSSNHSFDYVFAGPVLVKLSFE